MSKGSSGTSKAKFTSRNLNALHKAPAVRNDNPGYGAGRLVVLAKSRDKTAAKAGPVAAPTPVNTPSLRMENNGQDITVSLVPTGGPGWGKSRSAGRGTEAEDPAKNATPANESRRAPDKPVWGSGGQGEASEPERSRSRFGNDSRALRDDDFPDLSETARGGLSSRGDRERRSDVGRRGGDEYERRGEDRLRGDEDYYSRRGGGYDRRQESSEYRDYRDRYTGGSGRRYDDDDARESGGRSLRGDDWRGSRGGGDYASGRYGDGPESKRGARNQDGYGRGRDEDRYDDYDRQEERDRDFGRRGGYEDYRSGGRRYGYGSRSGSGYGGESRPYGKEHGDYSGRYERPEDGKREGRATYRDEGPEDRERDTYRRPTEYRDRPRNYEAPALKSERADTWRRDNENAEASPEDYRDSRQRSERSGEAGYPRSRDHQSRGVEEYGNSGPKGDREGAERDDGRAARDRERFSEGRKEVRGRRSLKDEADPAGREAGPESSSSSPSMTMEQVRIQKRPAGPKLLFDPKSGNMVEAPPRPNREDARNMEGSSNKVEKETPVSEAAPASNKSDEKMREPIRQVVVADGAGFSARVASRANPPKETAVDIVTNTSTSEYVILRKKKDKSQAPVRKAWATEPSSPAKAEAAAPEAVAEPNVNPVVASQKPEGDGLAPAKAVEKPAVSGAERRTLARANRESRLREKRQRGPRTSGTLYVYADGGEIVAAGRESSVGQSAGAGSAMESSASASKKDFSQASKAEQTSAAAAAAAAMDREAVAASMLELQGRVHEHAVESTEAEDENRLLMDLDQSTSEPLALTPKASDDGAAEAEFDYGLASSGANLPTSAQSASHPSVPHLAAGQLMFGDVALAVNTSGFFDSNELMKSAINSQHAGASADGSAGASGVSGGWDNRAFLGAGLNPVSAGGSGNSRSPQLSGGASLSSAGQGQGPSKDQTTAGEVSATAGKGSPMAAGQVPSHAHAQPQGQGQGQGQSQPMSQAYSDWAQQPLSGSMSMLHAWGSSPSSGGQSSHGEPFSSSMLLPNPLSSLSLPGNPGMYRQLFAANAGAFQGLPGPLLMQPYVGTMPSVNSSVSGNTWGMHGPSPQSGMRMTQPVTIQQLYAPFASMSTSGTSTASTNGMNAQASPFPSAWLSAPQQEGINDPTSSSFMNSSRKEAAHSSSPSLSPLGKKGAAGDDGAQEEKPPLPEMSFSSLKPSAAIEKSSQGSMAQYRAVGLFSMSKAGDDRLDSKWNPSADASKSPSARPMQGIAAAVGSNREAGVDGSSGVKEDLAGGRNPALQSFPAQQESLAYTQQSFLPKSKQDAGSGAEKGSGKRNGSRKGHGAVGDKGAAGGKPGGGRRGGGGRNNRSEVAGGDRANNRQGGGAGAGAGGPAGARGGPQEDRVSAGGPRNGGQGGKQARRGGKPGEGRRGDGATAKTSGSGPTATDGGIVGDGAEAKGTNGPRSGSSRARRQGGNSGSKGPKSYKASGGNHPRGAGQRAMQGQSGKQMYVAKNAADGSDKGAKQDATTKKTQTHRPSGSGVVDAKKQQQQPQAGTRAPGKTQDRQAETQATGCSSTE